jgi:predicted dehydrogenase
MKSSFGWAVIGPGAIAHRFADALTSIADARLVAVQSRNVDRAASFASKWASGANTTPLITESINALLANPDVDAVYIATPHAFHANAIEQCVRARKPVLCEKPLVTDAKTARALVQLARKHNTFLMEAVWTRFLPIYSVVAGWLREEKIGALRSLESTFCFDMPFDPRHRVFDPAQAGGALLDIGIYNITVTRWALQRALGTVPNLRDMTVDATLAPSGVDRSVTATLRFENNVTSFFTCATDRAAENSFHLIGDAGSITLHAGFWQATRATLALKNASPIHIDAPFRRNGFEYEIEAAMACIRDGLIECAVMPHAETISTLELMDEIRKRIGVRYPWE